MEQVALDVEKAIEIVRDDNGEAFFSDYCLLYNFTTENISAYLDVIKPKNGDVLTVTGSGDQALNSILYDAKNVTCFDINKLAYYYSELKRIAATVLPYNQFMSFFTRNVNYFNNEIYRMFSMFLPEDVKQFWDVLFSLFPSNRIGENLFRDRNVSFERMKAINPYTNKEKYLELQRKLFGYKVKYITSRIQDLNLSDNYDSINLSNIQEYITDQEFDAVCGNMEKHLNENGIALLTYFYHLRSIPNDISADEMYFESYKNIHEYDGILLSRKS